MTKKPPSYREESAQIYLVAHVRRQRAKAFQRFKLLLLIFLSLLAFAIWLFIVH